MNRTQSMPSLAVFFFFFFFLLMLLGYILFWIEKKIVVVLTTKKTPSYTPLERCATERREFSCTRLVLFSNCKSWSRFGGDVVSLACDLAWRSGCAFGCCDAFLFSPNSTRCTAKNVFCLFLGDSIRRPRQEPRNVPSSAHAWNNVQVRNTPLPVN